VLYKFMTYLFTYLLDRKVTCALKSQLQQVLKAHFSGTWPNSEKKPVTQKSKVTSSNIKIRKSDFKISDQSEIE